MSGSIATLKKLKNTEIKYYNFGTTNNWTCNINPLTLEMDI